MPLTHAYTVISLLQKQFRGKNTMRMPVSPQLPTPDADVSPELPPWLAGTGARTKTEPPELCQPHTPLCDPSLQGCSSWRYSQMVGSAACAQPSC